MNTVFFDVDTQLDFVCPAGSLYVPGAEMRIPVIAALNRRAARLISTVDAHLENDVEFRTWPPHCIAGTWGQRKPAETLVGGAQIVFEKTTTDAFLNPRLQTLLGELAADRYVLYGVVTEICVRFAALGLLKTGKPVDLVTDAVEMLNAQARDAFFAEFTAHGGRLLTSTDF